MMESRKGLISIIQIIICIAACGVIVCKLASFSQWDEMVAEMRSFDISNIILLTAVLLLMPANILCEADRWRKILRPLHEISLSEALSGVLVGLGGALSTPNRIGDIPMRALLLPADVRNRSIILGFTGAFAMNAVVAMTGIAAIPLYIALYGSSRIITPQYITIAVIISILLIVFLFAMPSLALKISSMVKTKEGNGISDKLVKGLHTLSLFSRRQMLSIIIITLLRYIVFASQYYLILLVFNAGITLANAIATIPIIYLLSTITPMISATESITRSGYALLLFAPFGIQAPEILFATLALWIINNAIPTLAGIAVYKRRMRENL